MSCTGSGPFTWYLYNNDWNLIDCVDNNQSSYSFTGITTAGTYNVVVINDGYSATTQFNITGNESCCWNSSLYQPCNEGCNQSGDGINVIKNGEDFQLTVNQNYGAIEIFFKKLNDLLGFNSTKNINSNPLDISVLYSSDDNKGTNVYFESLIRSYECCPVEPESEILFTSPCINEPVYKLLKICNTCDDAHIVSGYTFYDCGVNCPPGYTPDPDRLTCSKISYTAVTNPIEWCESPYPGYVCLYQVTQSYKTTAWSWAGTKFYDSLNTLSTPLENYLPEDQYNVVADSTNTLVPYQSWVTGSDFWGKAGGHGRLYDIGVWASPTDGSPINTWIGFSVCLNLIETREYFLGIGADNCVRIDVNGTTLVSLEKSNPGNYQLWHVFPITLSSGLNTIQLYGLNSGANAGFAAEIYSASTLAILTGATNESEAGVVWNTLQMSGGTFDLAGASGYTCSGDFIYSNCDSTPVCSKIERVNASGTTECSDNWDIRFLKYNADCGTRELAEFTPSTDISFTGTCDEVLYQYSECKCFYVAIGYRGENIDDHYTNFNIFLTDNSSTGLKTLSYDLHGRASISYAGSQLNLLNTITDAVPVGDLCPIKPGCDCLTITTTTTDNDGLPVSVGGLPYYQFTTTYSFKNSCYTEFNLGYITASTIYTGVTINDSNFNGVLGKNETATLSLSYSSQIKESIIGGLYYTASTIDPFQCVEPEIHCDGLLSFSFIPQDILISISNNHYNYGGVGVGCCSSNVFTIQNTGTVGITITNLATTNTAFTIVDPVTPLTAQRILSPNTELNLTITFCPLSGCSDSTQQVSDIIISTVEYGNLGGDNLNGGFSVSGTCITPSISASTESLLFIKQLNDQVVSGLTLCNRTNITQEVQISNCLQVITGTTEVTDSLDSGFEIVVDTVSTASITYPRSISISPYECTTMDIRYDTTIPDKIFCSVYMLDNCNNLYEIPFTGYSLPYPIVITSSSHTDPVCYGNSNGTITISFSGGVTPYTYILSGGSVYESGTLYTNTITFTDLPASEVGTDYIFYLSGNPCNGTIDVPDLSPFITASSPEVILSSPLITNLIQPLYFEATDVSYTGLTCISSGAASVRVTGGTTDYIFTWSNGVIETGSTTPYTSTITDLVAGTYSVVIDDFNGCQLIESTTIPYLLPISIFPEVNNVSCYGGSNGGINLLVTNAIDPVTYVWSGYTYDGYVVNPSHTDSFSSTTSNTLTAGTYYITCTDSNSCSASTLLYITQPDLLGFDITSTNVTCSYLTNGTIHFTPITGGTLPYSVYASGNTVSYSSSTTPIISNVASGYYETYVKDYNGCKTNSKGVLITKPDPMGIDYQYTATTCYNSSNGIISLYVTGGTSPYTYLWAPSIGTTNYVTGLKRGNYNVTVFDSNGCSLHSGFTLPFNSSYCGGLDVYGSNNVALPTIGSDYIVTFPHTCLSTVSEKIIKLCQNTPCDFTILSYTGITLFVDDFYLGSEITSYTIPSSGCTNISLVFNPTSAQTYNSYFTITTEYCTHGFILSGTGVIDTISADTRFIDFGNVCFGTGLTQNLTITNLTPDDRLLNIQTTPTDFTTTSSAFVLSGNSVVTIPYTFTPSYTSTAPIIWNKEYSGTTKITNCPTLDISMSGTGYGGNLYVSPINFGCVNYNCYSDQTVTVTNSHCLPVTLTSAVIPSYYSNELSILNFSANTLSPGGTYSFDVRYSALTSLSTLLFIYTDFSLASVIASGVTGCAVHSIANVPNPSSLTTVPGTSISTSVPVTNTTINNLFVSANITNFTGGTPSDVSVAPGMLVLPAPVLPITSTTSNFTITFNNALPVTGYYNLNLTDNCGNHISLPFYINSTLIGYTSSISYPSCNGNNNGSINLIPSGGTAPYTVVWDYGFTGETITGVSADTYNVVITDYYGNTSPFSFVITEPNPLAISHTIPSNGSYNILVYSADTGYINVNVSGGTNPYLYYWSGVTYDSKTFNSTNEDLTGLTAGNYSLTVTDNNGCQITDFITLTQPNPITVNITNCTPPVPPAPACVLTGGTAEITISGGQCPYSIIVCPTEPQNPLFAPGGQYSGYDSCQILPDCATVPSGTTCVTSTCYCCDESLYPCISGSCPCTHCDFVIHSLPPGSYNPGTIGVVDINSGHTIYTGSTIVPDPSTLDFTLTQTPTTCGGQANGTITVTIIPKTNGLGITHMGIPPYTYFLNGVQQGLSTSATTITFTGLTTNNYTVSVLDSEPTTVSQTIRVEQGRLFAGITTTSETLQTQNGSIIITHITGGIGPYTASLNGSTQITVTAGYVFELLSAGNYQIEIIDSLGCKFIAKTVVNRIVPPGEGQKLMGVRTSLTNQTIYEKRLGGSKIINKK